MFWWFILPLAALIIIGIWIDLKAKKEGRPLGGHERGPHAGHGGGVNNTPGNSGADGGGDGNS